MTRPLPLHYRDCMLDAGDDCNCHEIKERNTGMNEFQSAVEEFHRRTGGLGNVNTPEGRELRARLILEEAVETLAALGFAAYGAIHDPTAPDPWGEEPVASSSKTFSEYNDLEFIDGLCDLTYVVMGGAVNRRINIARHFDEVHRANMRKLDGPKRADGKQLKPEGWVGPDHQRILDTYHGTDA